MAKPSESLARYREMRDFDATPEPSGRSRREASRALSFVVQKHDASHLHYDFRLELDGTLKSWAVPKGPSLDPADKRMAVQVEDHPIEYGGFEGVIPEGHYGAGTVEIWDHGTWTPVGDPREGYRDGKLKFRLDGERLHGGWTLVRMRPRPHESKPSWLLIKERDDEARDGGVADAAKARPAKASRGGSRSKAVVARPAPSRPATKVSLPRTLSPQLAVLVTDVPTEGEWAYEVKLDGYRILARVDGDDVRLTTRNGLDWTAKLHALVDPLRALALGPSWLDGEIVAMGASGLPDFQSLQGAFEAEHAGALRYFVFDAPYLDGVDLRARPLVERRAALGARLGAGAPPVFFSPTLERDEHGKPRTPAELLERVCARGIEGLVGKRLDSPYVSARSTSWIKLKCSRRQEFVIGGFTAPKGSRVGIGALLIGVHDDEGRLRFAGKVGAGFSDEVLASLQTRLSKLEVQRSPFVDLDRPPSGSRWVSPKLVAEAAFSEWTSDGRLRHPVFKGLRLDKDPKTIKRERPVAADSPDAGKTTAHPARAQAASAKPARATSAAPSRKRPAAKTAAAATAPAAKIPAAKPRVAKASPSASPALVHGVRVTHPDRVIDPSTGITKGELAEYYDRAAAVMLPHLSTRPIALVRAPDGIDGEVFFNKHAEHSRMPRLTQLPAGLDPGHPPLLAIESADALVEVAQYNTIEVHTWNARAEKIETPDRFVLDLDPGEGVVFATLREGAKLVQSMLDELGLVAFLKTSGGKGLHIVVPITAKLGWDEVKGFTEAVVDHLAATLPDRFVARSGAEHRVGRVFVDYLRNGRGATTACAFSARARPGVGVSIPIGWDELDRIDSGAHWTIRTAHERFAHADDPWGAYAGKTQSLATAIKRLAQSAGAGESPGRASRTR